MGTHPNIAVIDRMTKAVFEKDRTTLGEVFADDLAFHVRGPLPQPGDYAGVDGFLATSRDCTPMRHPRRGGAPDGSGDAAGRLSP